jgi:glycosyltransferase involved in cell wall biosynthesis
MIDIYSKNYATVAVSRYIETELLNSSGIHNTITIHNAFDTNWVSEGDELPIELRDKQYLLWYGRVVDEIKDLRFLIDAFEQSEVWKRGTHLVIMGDGPDSEDINKYAKQSAAGAHVDFLPYTSDPFPVIKSARSTVLTSKYEGFPMVLVESLSVGTPVISLDIASGPSEIVVDGENGLLIPERSLPLFSEAIRKINDDDSLYERLSSNAKSSIEDFSMEAIAARWKKLLE